MGTGGGNVPLVLGFDAYNQNDTGDVAKNITAKADTDHIPVVMVIEDETKDCSDGSGRSIHDMESGRDSRYIEEPDGWASAGGGFGRG